MRKSCAEITTFLMFDGRAEEAMNFYSAVFEGAEILSISRYGPNEAGAEGSVMQARFSISGQAPLSAFTGQAPLSSFTGQAPLSAFTGQAPLSAFTGQEFMFIDSKVEHEFTFTPAMSLFVSCETEQEIDRIFDLLSDGGQILMPLDGYPFSQKYAWISDKFGVSWQLNMVGDTP